MKYEYYICGGPLMKHVNYVGLNYLLHHGTTETEFLDS